jgi:hypothetical protein
MDQWMLPETFIIVFCFVRRNMELFYIVGHVLALTLTTAVADVSAVLCLQRLARRKNILPSLIGFKK